MKQTLRNLDRIIKQLDLASGNLYNALDSLAFMGELGEEIQRLSDMIDISRVDLLRHELETIVEQRREERKGEK